MSQKIIVVVNPTTNVATATVSEPVIADILTTAISSDSALTGTYGFIQKALFVVGGMAIQNNRLGRGWNPLSAS